MKASIGPDHEHPAGVLGDERLLAEQLGQVVVGLEDPRSAPALEPGFEVRDPATHKGREDDDREDLEDLDLCRRQLDCDHPHLHVTTIPCVEAISPCRRFERPVHGHAHRSLIRHLSPYLVLAG